MFKGEKLSTVDKLKIDYVKQHFIAFAYNSPVSFVSLVTSIYFLIKMVYFGILSNACY